MDTTLIKLREAVLASMSYLRPHVLQWKPQRTTSHIKPGDQTLFSILDRESAKKGKSIMATIPRMALYIEDATGINVSNAELAGHFDALDGSRLASIRGPGYTVIAGIQDNKTGHLTHAVIGEPGRNCLWYASTKIPTTFEALNFNRPPRTVCKRRVNVWPAPYNSQSTILLDWNKGFNRGTKEKPRWILTKRQTDRLIHNINKRDLYLGMLGSNGLHHALVANGGENLVGGCTVGVGGPWDLPGLFLIERAGGAYWMLKKNTGGAFMVEHNILSADAAIYGNNKDTRDALLKDFINAAMSKE